MLKDSKLNSKVLKCTRAVCGDLKAEFFVKNQVLLFGFCLIFLQDFVFVRKFDSDKGTFKKKKEIPENCKIVFKEEMFLDVSINKLINSLID